MRKAKIEFQGKEIIVSTRHGRIDAPNWAKRYSYDDCRLDIKVECGGKSFISYWLSDRDVTSRELLSCVKMLCINATYGKMEIEEFAEEKCYENEKSPLCIRYYRRCRKTFEDFQKLGIDPNELGDYLAIKYGVLWGPSNIYMDQVI